MAARFIEGAAAIRAATSDHPKKKIRVKKAKRPARAAPPAAEPELEADDGDDDGDDFPDVSGAG